MKHRMKLSTSLNETINIPYFANTNQQTNPYVYFFGVFFQQILGEQKSHVLPVSSLDDFPPPGHGAPLQLRAVATVAPGVEEVSTCFVGTEGVTTKTGMKRMFFLLVEM